MMERYLSGLIDDHFTNNRQMAFVVGPRQVGKTTLCRNYGSDSAYLNWDDQDHRIDIISGPEAVARRLSLEVVTDLPKMVIFDEIHKYSKWKDFLKGFFDVYGDQLKILVTGSARLDIFKKSGDSLMGRYFLYRLHPISIGELINPIRDEFKEILAPRHVEKGEIENLLKFGGFPEPYLKNNQRFYNRWINLKNDIMFKEDLRELSHVKEVGQMETLAYILRQQSGQLTSVTSLAKKIRVSNDTISRWLNILQSLFYCFSIRPWTKNVTRTLIKEPKYYLWDWSIVKEEGPKKENFIASHLYKAVQYWNDAGLGEYGLYFLRDKEKREVDFIITRNNEPWFLVEVKSSMNRSLSPALIHFQQALHVPHAFQVVFDMEYADKDLFLLQRPMIVPAETLLSQLV